MNTPKSYKVIISGGGTGGHIFPAIAIANALKASNSNIEILFIGAKGRMEMEKVPAAGYKIEGLWISGLQRKLTLKNLSFPFKVVSSILKARQIIKKFKPNVVVGVGGFASGPTLRAAANMGIKTLIQEQNSYAGITNKLLAKKVDKICVAYDNMERFFPKNKIILTGNPVRKNVIELEGKKDKALEFFDLSKEKKTVLIIGGSLGARSINIGIQNNYKEIVESGLQIIWQTGKFYFETANDTTFDENDIYVSAFIKEMDYAYAVADIVVSRAGAIAISELCAVNKPCILVPSPNVAEDHQTKNAMALVEKEAALMVKDSETTEKLGKAIIELSNDLEKQKKLKENISKLAHKDAAKIIAELVLEMAEG
ncbi:MAG: undecaprenyldiphospho-muramoylpentapeptide beta-N-acetylglucosaminyltransferase [Saprospiraceae bacterium]|nr:undecaprenyldiphospho-muramoylpentapeptide beta-N-acetylglucosaminyltransferase [Saprospiraceae bacterium]